MSDSDRPSMVLKSEHQVILRVINVLQVLLERSEQGLTVDHDALTKCVLFFRLFADECHHAKEEDLLFPMLEQRGIPRDGGPIGVMLHEHKLARQYTQEMDVALQAWTAGDEALAARFHESARHYIELLRNHIFKEDNILFRMGDQALSAEDQQSLCQGFCDVGCRAFGGKKREELLTLADELEA